ncbi:MAG: hypothetical protein ABIL58_12810 [Pseudomonadota bacterium]
MCSLERSGSTVPQLENEPELYEDMVSHIRAFNRLDRSRRAGGFAAGAIPVSEIIAYLNEWGVEGVDARLDAIFWVQKIDEIMMSLCSEG